MVDGEEAWMGSRYPKTILPVLFPYNLGAQILPLSKELLTPERINRISINPQIPTDCNSVPVFLLSPQFLSPFPESRRPGS